MNLYNLLTKEITQEEFLNYYNITIEYINIPYSNINGFVDYYNNMYFIYINNNLSYFKKRKVLLHELAHIELNQLGQIDKDLFAFKVENFEDEADKYVKFLIKNTNFFEEETLYGK